MSSLPVQIKVGFSKGGSTCTNFEFQISATKVCKCMANRFRRTGTVPSSGQLKRVSCDNRSVRDFKLPGFTVTLPSMSMKRIEEEARLATKTTPLEKQKSLASLNVPSSISTSTGWCKRNSIDDTLRNEIVIQNKDFALGSMFKGFGFLA